MTWSPSVDDIVTAPQKETLARAKSIAAIKAEAQRRIIALVGARDFQDCLVRQLNAQMRATELVLVQSQNGTWTEAEAAEAAALQGLADAIKAIRAASNVLEAIDPIPADYADDSRWP